MKNFKKIFSAAILAMYLSTSTYGAYDEVTCDSNPAFGDQSCSQCFTGGEVAQGDNKGLLTDVWENYTESDHVLFKEEQEMPQIVSLGGASWAEVKASDSVDFWMYTEDLDALYDEDALGSVLPAGETVTWLESTVGSAYQLETNPAPQGENVGMILYDIVTHEVDEDGIPSTDSDAHRECVLFTSGTPGETPVVPETPRLPETGAEHLLLALVALMLGFGFLKFRNK